MWPFTSPRAGCQEISEAKWEIFKIDFTIAVMIKVSENDVTVSLAIKTYQYITEKIKITLKTFSDGSRV